MAEEQEPQTELVCIANASVGKGKTVKRGQTHDFLIPEEAAKARASNRFVLPDDPRAKAAKAEASKPAAKKTS